MPNKTRILIIYTGGTIGMMHDHDSGTLVPINFIEFPKQVPELYRFGYEYTSIAFEKPVDSSNMNPEMWVKLGKIIYDNYNDFDGFVVLHGTDTMAYASSAISYMFENLTKPIIFTGSQLPIGTIRNDGKNNLITSVEIAAARKDDKARVPEVCIYFQNRLFRANRATKLSTEDFNAFISDNYPSLAKSGIHIKYKDNAIRTASIDSRLTLHDKFDDNIAVLKMYPGINQNLIENILNTKGLRGVVIETFGAGNAPTDKWFLDVIKQAVWKGVVVFNVTQCSAGSVKMDEYQTGKFLIDAGVISGHDITTEAAVTKMMYLLGRTKNVDQIKIDLQKSIRGEITE